MIKKSSIKKKKPKNIANYFFLRKKNHFYFLFIADRRGVVTPGYRAEHERVGEDYVIANNKAYGTVKITQPQVNFLVKSSFDQYY